METLLVGDGHEDRFEALAHVVADVIEPPARYS